jgi:hypothetical protein
MTYKKKLTSLSGLTGLLILIFLVTLFYEPDRVTRRGASYSWLDPRVLDQADGVEIYKAGDWDNPVNFARRGDTWFALIEGSDFPVRQERITDLLSVLSGRGAYTLRGSSSSSHEALGLIPNSAARIVVKGGVGLPLLDLLVGNPDATGSEIYLRKNNLDEVRSGEDKLSTYVKSTDSSWYNLKLFQGSEQVTDTTLVQRVAIYAPASPGGEDETLPPEPVVLSRNNSGGWSIEGRDDITVDGSNADSYVRAVLAAEGENFMPGISANDPMFNEGRVVLELGNRTSRTIAVGPVVDGAKRYAAASGSPYVFLLAEWTLGRIFHDAQYFTAR